MLDFSDYGELIDSIDGDYSPEEIAAVGNAIRLWCGWHIAPVKTDDEMVIDSNRGSLLVLPTLLMQEPSAVVDADGNDITGWSWSEIGNLELPFGQYFPQGFRAVKVTVTHGFTTAPTEIVAVAAHMLRERADEIATGGPPLKTAQLDGAMLAYDTAKVSGLLRSMDDYAYAIGRYRL